MISLLRWSPTDHKTGGAFDNNGDMGTLKEFISSSQPKQDLAHSSCEYTSQRLKMTEIGGKMVSTALEEVLFALSGPVGE